MYATGMQPPPTKESEVFENIFEYIDRVFGMVRPRKLLYMAIGMFLLPACQQLMIVSQHFECLLNRPCPCHSSQRTASSETYVHPLRDVT